MSFAALPTELQLRIILECLPPQHLVASPNARRETQQALTLATVSRRCYALVARWLYRNVRATSPSSLRQLHAALCRHPELRILVESIHLGPETELPALGWPLTMLEDGPDYQHVLALTPSVQLFSEKLLPTWCEPGLAFPLECLVDKGCQGFTIFSAMKSAAKDLNVNPFAMRHSQSDRDIGFRAWTSRIFLLQAALDLYLLEMRRADDERGYDIVEERPAKRPWGKPRTARACKESTCDHYPSLRVLHAPSSSATPAHAGVLVLTVGQLWHHVEERGGPCDHFDSALHLAHSTRLGDGLARTDWRRVLFPLGVSQAERLTHELQQAFKEEDDQALQALTPNHEEARLATRATTAVPLGKVEDLMHLAHSILAWTPRVTNLSLTSYLYGALATVATVQPLSSVSLGPGFGCAYLVLSSLGIDRRKKLQRLRIVGQISEVDARMLCYDLPGLEELEWVCPTSFWPLAGHIIDILQGRRPVASTHGVGPFVRGVEGASGSSSGASASDATEGRSGASLSLTSSKRRTTVLLRQADAVVNDPQVMHHVHVASIGLPPNEFIRRWPELENMAPIVALLRANGRTWWDKGHTAG